VSVCWTSCWGLTSHTHQLDPWDCRASILTSASSFIKGRVRAGQQAIDAPYSLTMSESESPTPRGRYQFPAHIGYIFTPKCNLCGQIGRRCVPCKGSTSVCFMCQKQKKRCFCESIFRSHRSHQPGLILIWSSRNRPYDRPRSLSTIPTTTDPKL
jgi:hypothetical protein